MCGQASSLRAVEDAFHVNLEDSVVGIRGDLAKRRILRDGGIRERNIEPTLLALDLRDETIEVGKVRSSRSDQLTLRMSSCRSTSASACSQSSSSKPSTYPRRA